MARHRRRKQKKTSFVGDVFHFILAITLIVVAVFVVIFVIGKVKGITGELGEKPERITASQTDGQLTIENETETAVGFQENEAGEVRWLKADGKTYAKNEWVEQDGKLYYFNENELRQTGIKGIEGMLYTFGADGALEKISYNRTYSPDKNTVIRDYPSLVKSKKLWAFLGEGKLGEFQALMYKKTTEAMAHQLGGDGNPQYTSPYSMQIDGDYIYFLPYAKAPESDLSDEEKAIDRTLYRMRPSDTARQIVAENVEGYKVFEGTVYYYADGKLQTTDTAKNDPTKNPKKQPSGDEVLYVEIMDGAAYLTDGSGEPVTSDSGEIKARGFTYSLNADGTISGVNKKTTVNTGGYTYYVESDTAFGEPISRVMRKDGNGNSQIISTEFAGAVGNLRYDYDAGNIIAEYTDASGVGKVLKISKSGDVDCLSDAAAASGKLTVIAVQNGQVLYMKGSGSSASYGALSLSEAEPLAVGVDPVDTGKDGDGEPVISDEPAETGETTKAASDTETAVNPDGTSQKTESEAANAAPVETAAPQPSSESGNTVISPNGPDTNVGVSPNPNAVSPDGIVIGDAPL